MLNYDSIGNQKILREFVNQNVFACITDFAEYLFDVDDEKYAVYDEFQNFWHYLCPECGEVIKEDEWDCEEPTPEEDFGVCPHCGATIDKESSYEACEIFEYWIVDPWFGEKLRDHGECVLERPMGWIWGRQGSGQAIYLDSVIGKIAEGVEILEGQDRDWSKR